MGAREELRLLRKRGHAPRLGESTSGITSGWVATVNADGDYAHVDPSSIGGGGSSQTYFHFSYRSARWQSQTDATGILTDTGESTSSTGSASTTQDSDGIWSTRTSSASTGSGAGIRTTTAQCRFDSLQRAYFRFKTGSDVTNVYYWIILFPASGAPSNSSAFTDSHAGLLFDGTDAFATVADGSTQSTTDLGVGLSADTVYVVEVTRDGTDYTITLRDTSGTSLGTATMTSNTPSASADCCMHARLFTNENVAKVIHFGQVYVEST